MNTRSRLVFSWMFVIGLAGCTSPAPPKKPVPQSVATNAPTVLPFAPEPLPSAPAPSVSASVSPVPIASASVSAETPSPPRVVVCMDCNASPIVHYVHFDHRKSDIQKSNLPLLEAAQEILMKYPRVRVEIQGHADMSEVLAGFKSIGLARAEAVKKWFVEHGVDPKQLVTKDYGATQPLVVPHSEKEKAINRRVHLNQIAK